MTKKESSKYKARAVDAAGVAHYSAEENQIWRELVLRQLPVVANRACDEYLRGIELLGFSHDHIPQCAEISKVLEKMTGWSLEPVTALISFDHFFKLLANRKFPAATFIRHRDEIDYLQEPDIFHEVFGHCPLLTHQAYADFTEMYGKLGLDANPEDRAMLAKLYWFTIEFGLMQTKKGMRIYGGGILSSKNETIYALESDVPIRKPFDVLEVLRTPYRIDIVQPVYFYIEHFDVLFDLINMDLLGLIDKARQLGMYQPLFSVKD